MTLQLEDLDLLIFLASKKIKMSQNNSIDFSNFNSINEKENFIKDIIKNNLIYRKYSVFLSFKWIV